MKSRESWKSLLEQAMKRVEDEAVAAAAAAAEAARRGGERLERSGSRRFSLWKSSS